MTFLRVYGATVVVLAFGAAAVGPAHAQRRDGHLLPQDKSGPVTAVGCLAKGTDVRGGKKDKYVLGHPKRGPVASVPEATCTVDAGAPALTIDNPEKGGITDASLGRWVEISGRLESETDKDPDNLRELDVATFKLVPVVVPARPAAAARRSEPAPAPAPAARAAEPVASAAPAPPAPAHHTLPKTASQLPALGLVGLLSLAAGLMLRSFRLRQRV